MEAMEDGYLARILLPDGAKDIPVSTVSDESPVMYGMRMEPKIYLSAFSTVGEESNIIRLIIMLAL